MTIYDGIAKLVVVFVSMGTRFKRDTLSEASSSIEPRNFVDQVPEARPNITTHDGLWAELDKLEKDRVLAREVLKRRGFLGTAHASALNELRKMQIELARQISHEGHSLAMEHYQELWKVGDPEVLRTRLFDDPHFELLDENVSKMAEKLNEIAAMLDASELLNRFQNSPMEQESDFDTVTDIASADAAESRFTTSAAPSLAESTMLTSEPAVETSSSEMKSLRSFGETSDRATSQE